MQKKHRWNEGIEAYSEPSRTSKMIFLQKQLTAFSC